MAVHLASAGSAANTNLMQRTDSIYKTETDGIPNIAIVRGSEVDLLRWLHLLLTSLQSTADGVLVGKSWSQRCLCEARSGRNSGTGEDGWVCWRPESGLGGSLEWDELNHGVPLPVGWRGQDGSGLQGKLRHVFRVFSYHWPYVSVLLVEELSIRRAPRCSVRDCLISRSGRQAVLPVFWIVKGDLQLLPTDFT